MSRKLEILTKFVFENPEESVWLQSALARIPDSKPIDSDDPREKLACLHLRTLRSYRAWVPQSVRIVPESLTFPTNADQSLLVASLVVATWLSRWHPDRVVTLEYKLANCSHSYMQVDQYGG